MYISNNIAERIRSTAKGKGVSMKKLLEDIGLGFNTMSNMKTSIPKADNLAKIADYLDCSVDYLLGRTDIPEIQSSEVNSTESEVIKNLRRLNSKGKENILDYSIDLVASGRYKTEYAEEYSPAAKLAAYGGDNFAEWEEESPKGTF